MKRLKMLTKGPNKNYKVGEVVEVDDQRAARLIEGEHAKEVRDDPGGNQKPKVVR